MILDGHAPVLLETSSLRRRLVPDEPVTVRMRFAPTVRGCDRVSGIGTMMPSDNGLGELPTLSRLDGPILKTAGSGFATRRPSGSRSRPTSVLALALVLFCNPPITWGAPKTTGAIRPGEGIAATAARSTGSQGSDAQVFEAAMRTGMEALTSGDPAAAAEAFARAVALQPRHPLALTLLGDALLEAGRVGDAVEDVGNRDDEVRAAQALRRTLELRPGEPGASLALATIYRRFGLYEDAIEVLDSVVSTASGNAALELERVRVLSRRGEYQRARDAAERAIEAGAGPDAHYYLGMVLKNQFDLDGALEAFRAAADAAADPSVAQRELASLLIDRRRYDEARAVLERAVAAAPSDAQAHYLLGVAVLRAGDPEGALPNLERALQLDPDLASALYALSAARRLLGHVEESLSAMQRFKALSDQQQGGAGRVEQHTATLNQQGILYYRIGEPARALERFQRALEIDSEGDLATFNIGLAYAGLGNHLEAVAAFERAIERNPNRPETYAALAREYRALGRLEDAARMQARYEELLRRQLPLHGLLLREREGPSLGPARTASRGFHSFSQRPCSVVEATTPRP